MSARPLAIDLFCGLGGWTEGFLAEGYDVVGFDIERHQYGDQKYPAQLVLQDVLTLHGSQFRDAAVIVASPPCQAYSYRAMPWKRAKALPPPSNELFDACFRIADEADVPIVVENVKGAQPWVGRARWHYGSFYLWGDVPALMPAAWRGKLPFGHDPFKVNGKPCNKFTDPRYGSNADGNKNARNWWSDGSGSLSATTSSKSPARKAASAQIAKIPLPLSQWIARCYAPLANESAGLRSQEPE